MYMFQTYFEIEQMKNFNRIIYFYLIMANNQIKFGIKPLALQLHLYEDNIMMYSKLILNDKTIKVMMFNVLTFHNNRLTCTLNL